MYRRGPRRLDLGPVLLPNASSVSEKTPSGKLVNRSGGEARRSYGSLPDISGLGAPARAQPMQLASLEVVSQSSSFSGLPQ